MSGLKGMVSSHRFRFYWKILTRAERKSLFILAVSAAVMGTGFLAVLSLIFSYGNFFKAVGLSGGTAWESRLAGEMKIRAERIGELSRHPLFAGRGGKAVPPIKTGVPPRPGSQVLELYSLAGVVRLGEELKAFVTTSNGDSLYVGKGEAVGDYVVLRVESGEVLLVEKKTIRGRTLQSVLEDAAAAKYLIYSKPDSPAEKENSGN